MTGDVVALFFSLAIILVTENEQSALVITVKY